MPSTAMPEAFQSDAAFLKIKRGKGAKFRRVPVSRQLRRELIRYVNRMRPQCQSDRLLFLSDGTPVLWTDDAQLLFLSVDRAKLATNHRPVPW